MHVSKTIDATGLICPLPLLKAKLALKDLAVDQVLEIMSTDKGSVADLAAFCRIAGHQLLKQNQQDGVFTFYIQKK